MELETSCVRTSDDGEVLLVGFADDELDTQRYVLLQRSRHVAREERALGQHHVYITVNDPSRSAYGAIRRLEVEPTAIRISLDPDVAQVIQTDSEMYIRFPQTEAETARLVESLKELFAEDPERLVLRR